MEEFKQALEECLNPDYSLFYESIESKADYLLSVAKKVINHI